MKREVKHPLRALIALAIVFAMVLTTGCGGGGGGTTENASEPSGDGAAATDTPAAPESGFVLSVCDGPDPDTIDPALNSSVDGATLILHGFEGLYSLDEDGTPIPGQAESVDISDDGIVYTFHLRQGLQWSDGSPLTAHDFVYSWARAIDPDTAADYEYMFESVAGYEDGELAVEALDDNTLQVELIAMTPYFLELAAFPVYYPVKQEIVETYGDAWATQPDTYIGNGPYKVVEWVPGSHILFEKNAYYWNVDALGPDSIKFVLIEDDNARLAGYNSGQLDYIRQVPNDEIEALKSDPEFNIIGQLGTYYVSFNTQVPPLDNPKFRQALTLAVDRDYITKNIGQGGQINAPAYVAEGLADAAPGSSFRAVGGDYYDPSAEGFEANLAEAKAIMDELYPNGDCPTLEYVYNENTGHQLIGEALQQMWAEIWVPITLQVQEWSVFLNSRKNGEYQIARNGWLNDHSDPIGMLDMFITGGGNNDGQWSNTEYDAIISQVKASSDQNERFKLMHEAEDIIFAEWMLCPIYYYVDMFMIRSDISGHYTSPLGYHYFMYTTR